MPLYVVATPIGNPEDITRRALSILRICPTIIGEEFREVSTLLKRYDLSGKKLEQLNEHSQPEDVARLTAMCAEQDVALVSDCGTPGFCDPGAQLVESCRARGIRVIPVPGVSSLMAMLSVSGLRLDDFWFRGFLPANREERVPALKEVLRSARPVIVMDTPYRLGRLLEELAVAAPERSAVLALNLTHADELVDRAEIRELQNRHGGKKVEFLLLLLPENRPNQGAGSPALRRKTSRKK